LPHVYISRQNLPAGKQRLDCIQPKTKFYQVMKKNFFSIALSAMFSLSLVFVACNRSNEVQPQNIISEKNDVYTHRTPLDYKDIYLASLRKSSRNLGSIVSYQNNVVTHSLSVGTHLNNTYFQIPNFPYTNFTQANLSLPANFNESVIYYSEGQKTLLSSLYENIKAINDVNDAQLVAENFSETVEASSLSENEKEQLRGIAGGVLALVTFINEGGIDTIQDQLVNINGGSGMLQGRCSVSSRSVLIGAVVGFFGGAGYGFWVGGVHGAVMGGAWGFGSGAVTTIAAELIATCGRG